MTKPIILVTMGEPGGIGPDICLDLSHISDITLVIVGDINLLSSRAKLLNKTVNLRKVSHEQLTTLDIHGNENNEILVLHVDCLILDTVGKTHVENASYVLKLIDIGSDLCSKGVAKALITSPVNKEVINRAGYEFSGHTEYLASKFECNKVVMMLANPHMKVALLTTHIPLKEVPNYITSANIENTLQIIVDSFKRHYLIDNPRIGVCGLNPHAGEGGYLGTEEIEIINPVIKKWQDKGYTIFGAYPSDTIFNQAKDFDVILAMYHDQGLPVLKYSDFEHGINITLGLPILRISVDHGTAIDLAGSGRASSKSLKQAIIEAKLLLNKRK